MSCRSCFQCRFESSKVASSHTFDTAMFRSNTIVVVFTEVQDTVTCYGRTSYGVGSVGKGIALPTLVREAVDSLLTTLLSWRPSRVVATVAALFLGVAVVAGTYGWPQPNRIPELAGVVLAAMLTSALATERHAARQWTTVPPSFVINFTALLLLGPHAMIFVAACGVVMHALTDPRRPHAFRWAISDTVITLAAALAAGLVHQAARRHDWHLRVAGTGTADRARRGRLLRREEHFGRHHRAARHEATDQSIVADTASYAASRATAIGPASPWDLRR